METTQSADGTTIACDRSGEGPALILVTGAFTDRTTPASLAALLARDFTVYVYDRRGRGASGNTAPYAIEREIEDLDAVIALAGGTAMVFGHSSGGALSLEAAAAGSAISRLAVYEPPYIVDDSRTRPVDLAARVKARLAEGDRSGAARLFFLEGMGYPEPGVRAMARRPAWADLEAMAHLVPHELAAASGMWMPADRIAKISIPALLLDGGASPAWCRNTVQGVAETITGARRVSLAGQTHGAADEVLLPVLVDFFTA